MPRETQHDIRQMADYLRKYGESSHRLTAVDSAVNDRLWCAGGEISYDPDSYEPARDQMRRISSGRRAINNFSSYLSELAGAGKQVWIVEISYYRDDNDAKYSSSVDRVTHVTSIADIESAAGQSDQSDSWTDYSYEIFVI